MTSTERQLLIDRAIERLETLRVVPDRQAAHRVASGLLEDLAMQMGAGRQDKVYFDPRVINAYLAACRPGAEPFASGACSGTASPVTDGQEPAPQVSALPPSPARGSSLLHSLGSWLVPLLLAFHALNTGYARAEDAMDAYVDGLRLVQLYGTEEALRPENDAHTKAQLGKALGKDGRLAIPALKGLIDTETLTRLGGSDGSLDAKEVADALASAIPASRTRLLPQVAAHLDALATSLDRIEESKRPAAVSLGEWIASHYQADAQMGVLLVCTGNTRRSILGATMGNASAAYLGLPQVRFASGGTEVSACNERTIRALKEVGIRIEPTGAEAKRGEERVPNPIYRVRWGEPRPGDSFVLETTEHSKLFRDALPPNTPMAALMVCGEADAACPFVPGASLRLSVPYLDPKLFDGSRYESAKYAERRDDEARLVLSALTLARQHLKAAGKLP